MSSRMMQWVKDRSRCRSLLPTRKAKARRTGDCFVLASNLSGQIVPICVHHPVYTSSSLRGEHVKVSTRTARSDRIYY